MSDLLLLGLVELPRPTCNLACVCAHTTNTHSLLHQVVEDETGHDGDGHGAWTVSKHLRHLLVLQTNHVLAIHLCDVMVGQNTIPTGGRKTIFT